MTDLVISGDVKFTLLNEQAVQVTSVIADTFNFTIDYNEKDLAFTQDALKRAEVWKEYLSTTWNVCAPPVKRYGRTCTDRQAGQIIRQAAENIQKYGWVQGTGGSYATGFCVLGAINSTHAPVGRVVADMFLSWLTDIIGADFSSIPEWNDHKDRTKEEILKYMFKFADEMAPISPAELKD